MRYESNEVADAFVESRLDAGWTGAFGTLGPGIDASRIARLAVAQTT